MTGAFRKISFSARENTARLCLSARERMDAWPLSRRLDPYQPVLGRQVAFLHLPTIPSETMEKKQKGLKEASFNER